MDEGVVEGGEDVGNTENELALSDLGTEGDGVLLLSDFDFFGCLSNIIQKSALQSIGFAPYFAQKPLIGRLDVRC